MGHYYLVRLARSWPAEFHLTDGCPWLCHTQGKPLAASHGSHPCSLHRYQNLTMQTHYKSVRTVALIFCSEIAAGC